MKFSLKDLTAPTQPVVEPIDDPSAGHDDDQPSVLFGEDLSALQEVGTLEDGQPSGSLESLQVEGLDQNKLTAGPESRCCGDMGNMPPPCISRVIDKEGRAYIRIILGTYERMNTYMSRIVGLISSASENDLVDITIDTANNFSIHVLRNLLSAIDNCRATVITHAGFLTSLCDVVLWLSGDEIRWSKKMSCIMCRQQFTEYSGDIRDFVGKAEDAASNFDEFSKFISDKGLFTAAELKNMFETRGMLSLSGQELDVRMAKVLSVQAD